MSEFSYQLIPFAFIFLIVLFYLYKKKKHDYQNEQNNLETHEIF